MTERGILMTPENYGKCADGSKVQTRRIVKPQPLPGLVYWMSHDKTHAIQNGPDYPDGPEDCVTCPYGTVGDRLYVKEGLARSCNTNGVRYRRDHQIVSAAPWQWQKDYLSPLHMPKWAARLWLEIVDVSVERLQEITEEEARAEGCQPVMHADGAVDCGTRKTTFRHLWESINGQGSWERNDWIWVISFKPVSP